MPSFPTGTNCSEAGCKGGLASGLSGISTREMLDLLDSLEQSG